MSLASILAIVASATLGIFAWRGARIWIDYGRFATPAGNVPTAPRRLRWALWGAIVPSRYWWGGRLEVMSPEEQQQLLASETRALGLSRADSERCPLCGAEISRAWTLSRAGRPTVAPGPVHCPACDFRLDSCRHCNHFLPGAPRSSFQLSPSEVDITSGRCALYKRSQPVEEAAAPDVARTLKQRGYERVRAPMQIKDSMLRPDSCRAFEPDPQRSKASGVSWPGPRRIALLHLQGITPQGGPLDSERLSEEEKWLL